MTSPNPEPIDPSKLRPGPIRHESLSPDLLEHIQAVYDVVGPYLSTTLEQFEIGFMRETNPEDEVAVWASITAAWIDYHKQHLDDEPLPDEDEKDWGGKADVGAQKDIFRLLAGVSFHGTID